MQDLKTVADHQCKYQYSDESYCGRSTTHNYPDREKKDLCIYHTRNDNKLKAIEQELEKKIRENNQLVKDEIKKGEFTEKNNQNEIKEIRFKYKIILEGAYFPNKYRLLSDTRKIPIESDISFYKATFSGKFFPLNTVFKGKASFVATNFEALSNFNNVVFHDDAIFTKATFKDTVLFIDSKFISKADFAETNFECTTEFFKVSFHYIANFLAAKFHKPAYFKYATFSEDTNFALSIFSDESDFQHSIFKNKSSFHDAKFLNNVSFIFSTFIVKPDFDNTLFEKNSDFRGSLFVDGAGFQNSKFLNILDFSFAAFLKGTLDFSYASFRPDTTHFTETVFNNVVLLNNTILKGVRFTGCYLGGCSFHNSDIRDAVFINCSWNLNYLENQLNVLITALTSSKEKKWILEKDNIIEIFNPGHLPEHKTRKIVIYDEIIYSRMKMISDPSLCEKLCRFCFKYLSIIKLAMLLIVLFLTYYCISLNIVHAIIFSVSLEFIIANIFLVNIIKKRLSNKNIISLPKATIRKDVKKSIKPSYLEGLYCQFKASQDGNKSYSQANDFYFGEKLWERKKLYHEENGKPMWFFLWLYWALNGYGNRPVRTIINFVLLLLFFSWSLVQLGWIEKSSFKENFYDKSCGKQIILECKINIMDYFKAFPAINTCLSLVSNNKNVLFFRNTKNKIQDKHLDRKINILDVFLWNLSSSPSSKNSEYLSKDSIESKMSIFLIQWLFRPFMIAMVIISTRRKIQRH